MIGVRRGVLYREFAVLGWTAAACGVMGAGLFAVAIVTDYPPGIRGLYMLAGFVLLFAGFFGLGVHRMNRIVLTPDRLIIGRERFGRGDIDAVFGVQPPLVLDPDEQRRVEDLIPLEADRPVRIVGGSWGRRIGTALVLLRDARDGRALAVFSSRPREFADTLTRWLTTVPDTPEGLIDGGRGG